jgi:release factor glutamine methyltransferase
MLRPGGVMVIEHGADQGEPMGRLAVDAGFAEVTTIPDLLGRDRVLRAVFPG